MLFYVVSYPYFHWFEESKSLFRKNFIIGVATALLLLFSPVLGVLIFVVFVFAALAHFPYDFVSYVRWDDYSEQFLIDYGVSIYRRLPAMATHPSQLEDDVDDSYHSGRDDGSKAGSVVYPQGSDAAGISGTASADDGGRPSVEMMEQTGGSRVGAQHQAARLGRPLSGRERGLKKGKSFNPLSAGLATFEGLEALNPLNNIGTVRSFFKAGTIFVTFKYHSSTRCQVVRKFCLTHSH